MSNLEETIAHNVNAWNRQMDKLATYDTAVCPDCDGPANPKLVELWGHCIKCHKAQAGH